MASLVISDPCYSNMYSISCLAEEKSVGVCQSKNLKGPYLFLAATQ